MGKVKNHHGYFPCALGPFHSRFRSTQNESRQLRISPLLASDALSLLHLQSQTEPVSNNIPRLCYSLLLGICCGPINGLESDDRIQARGDTSLGRPLSRWILVFRLLIFHFTCERIGHKVIIFIRLDAMRFPFNLDVEGHIALTPGQCRGKCV